MSTHYQLLLDHPEVAQFFFDKHYTKTEDDDECWEWEGFVDELRGGYGHFICRHIGIDGQLRAHRVSYALEHRLLLTPKHHVLHRCDNRPCIRPSHLFLGDQKSNMADMVKKKRTAIGEHHSQAKLTEADARAILADNRLQAEIAEDYGISVPTVSDIKRARSWKHLHAAPSRRKVLGKR